MINSFCSFRNPPTWQEEFDGTAGSPLNPAIWNFSILSPQAGYNANSTINSTTVAYQDGNSNAVLQVNEIADGIYTGAQISTGPLLAGNIGGPEFSVSPPAYGEIRAKLPYASGIWPGSVYLVGTDYINVGFPDDGEIDFSEQFGSTSTEGGSVDTAVHQSIISSSYLDGGIFNTIPWDGNVMAFHRYGIRLETDAVAFFVDGTEVMVQTAESIGSWGLNIPFYIVADLFVGDSSSVAGAPNGTTFPQQLLIDYIRVWQD